MVYNPPYKDQGPTANQRKYLPNGEFCEVLLYNAFDEVR